MNPDWYGVLVIILSVTLAIFLILSIILAVKAIKIANTIERITDQAERVANRAEHISEFFEKTAGPVAIAKMVANLSSSFKGSSDSKKGKQ